VRSFIVEQPYKQKTNMFQADHNPKHFLRSVFLCGLYLSLNLSPANAQADQSQTGDPSPDLPSSLSPNSASPSSLPILPQPPPLKDRPPIPTPPAVTLPNVPDSDQAKPSLSWRTKAYALGNEVPFTGSPDRLSWSLPTSFERAGQLLSSALNQTGFQLLASYPDAGHYLARLKGEDGDTQIIIVVQPISESSTSFLLRILPEGHHRDRRRIDDLPKVMNTILGNRGVL
jgi:hypothetical protein